jgi:hypothetical protein
VFSNLFCFKNSPIKPGLARDFLKHALDVVFTAQNAKITVRCMHAQNTIITRHCKLKKAKHFQQRFPRLSHSPEIALRGAFFSLPLWHPSEVAALKMFYVEHS